jgi:hypothetical protein
MAAEEDHNGGRSPSDSPTKVDHSFDDLARAVAEGSLSRRRALKLFAGTALAALIPSRALADDDDDCVRICHVPFDREKEECDFANAQTRCVSRRERRRHLENHPCDCRGRCANCLTPPVVCSSTDVCGSPPACEGDPDCFCLGTVEGTGFCHRDSFCDELQTCTTTLDCPPGYACSASTCCSVEGVCIPPCAGTSDLPAARGAGPTTAGR